MTILAQNQNFEQTTLITVPFYGNELFVVAHNNEPYTPMKPIVEGMGLDWKSQFTKLKQRFASTVVEITIVANDGKERLMTCLPLRKLFGWLMTISPNKVNPEIRDTVIKYQEECDDVLYNYWTKGVAVKPISDLTETLSQTLNQISKGNKKLYMSMYNGLTRRFAVGRLADIPHTEIHNALATIYFFAVEWHRKNTPTQLPLKLNDGEHYLVVKDGVVLWERKLKPNCNDIPANTLQNPKLMLEHIREVVGEFVGKEALPAPKPQNSETVRELVERILIQNFTLNHIWKSLHALDKGLYLRAINYVVNTNVRVLRVIEDFGFKTKQGNDMISCDFRTIQLYDGRTITGCNPNYFNAFA